MVPFSQAKRALISIAADGRRWLPLQKNLVLVETYGGLQSTSGMLEGRSTPLWHQIIVITLPWISSALSPIVETLSRIQWYQSTNSYRSVNRIETAISGSGSGQFMVCTAVESNGMETPTSQSYQWMIECKTEGSFRPLIMCYPPNEGN